MIRICIQKSTGRYIEGQEHAREGTLINNAIKQGYDPNDLKEEVVDDATFRAILEQKKTQGQKDREEKEKLIKNKIRDLAIKDLKKDGKLDNNGDLIK